MLYRDTPRWKAVGYFCRRAPSWMFDRILNATLPNNYLALHQKLATFPGMFGDISWNVWWHSPGYLATFPGMFDGIHWNIWRHSPESLSTFPECLATFPGMFGDIPRNITFPPFPTFPYSVPRSCIPGFIHSHSNDLIHTAFLWK